MRCRTRHRDDLYGHTSKAIGGKEHAKIIFIVVLHHGYTADVFMFRLCRFV